MMNIGFSTGAVALGDVQRAIHILARSRSTVVELSALRLREIPALIEAVPSLDLARYVYVSVHAPNDFRAEDERRVATVLTRFAERGWPVVVHPDTIVDWGVWAEFGASLLVENMDKRRSLGKNVGELERVFERLPEARLCLDLAHARQVDTSMLEAFLILRRFGKRLGQVHVSELDTTSRHHRLSRGGIAALREVSSLIPADIPVIIEAPVGPDEIEAEIAASLEALGRTAPLLSAA